MLSVVILTFNSEKYLKEVLQSASFADEIIVLDSGSSDTTEQICKQFKNVKFQHQSWLGFGKQKRAAVDLASNDWVFALDSDEVIMPLLKDEILSVLKEPEFDAYKVARLNLFFGKEVRSMGLYPDFTVRLFNKNRANFNDKEVHEKVVVKGDTGELKNPLKHYAYESIEQFIAKQNRYSSLGAQKSKFKAIFNPAWTFFRLFILKKGFMDGWHGYVIAKLYAQYTFWKYIK
ncbi:glycosyltransferase family 2 protein [Campylobacter sp. RM15925]|uniref:glycosyltransferase family 2 protein n=1 Tax=Campylobacter sp. RM15925 TaxID=1705724 RepID=UPI001474BD22|nr:glycosyltransferase family 2 protein [Campylobacter sp. RM15925]